MQSINFKLNNIYGGKSELRGRIEIRDDNIVIAFDGFGDCCSDKGKGFPVLIENKEGTPHVVVWGDINHEDPTNVISLEDAAESKFKHK
jgi:hypothetical protein